ncbi:MAG: 2-isopropylmalate synthase [Calditrichae bacterium]|nr:2-isopropylmalate synthase [Calditrichia bacterium]
MVKILDSTLREGEQTPGVCFSNHIKTAIAELLDEIGIDIIEAGHPAVTDEIKRFIRYISQTDLKTVIGAHSRSIKEDVDLALECGIDFLGIFYCVSNNMLEHHDKTFSQVLDQITRIISYAKEKRPDLTIRYTPEDTVRSEWGNVITAAGNAVDAGADIISIADTTGYMIPGTQRSMYDYVRRLKDELAARGAFPQIAVHCHNDRGLALANVLDAFRAGVDIIDVTVMGLGERAGLVDMASLLSVLITDFSVDAPWNLGKLPPLYDIVSRYSGIDIPPMYPLTGMNAFTHCAGVHTQAALKNPLHYQSLSPDLVGRTPKISLDHMSGLSSVKYMLAETGEPDLEKELVLKILDQVKQIGRMGRTVDKQELKFIVNHVKKERG